MRARILLAAFCLILPVAAEKTQAQKEWALGAAAMLAPAGVVRPDLLAAVKSRAELLDLLQKLLHDDLDRTKIGWNYPRLINLSRWGYANELLQEDEAWSYIMPAAERLQKTFASWQELGQGYMDGRAKWYSSDLGDLRRADYAYRMLLWDRDSPWRKYPWNLDLGNGYSAPPSIDKTAWLELAAHPGGLICVRMTVPDHRDDVEYEAAIEDAVGCRPYVKGQRRDGPDWIIDTECLQPDTLHKSGIVARFHLEPIAETLRREGITQVFTTFEHQPNGPYSELVPPALDDWIRGGWHWYFDVESLGQKLPDTTLSYGVPAEGVRMFQAGAILFIAMSLAAAWMLRRGSAWLTQRFSLFYWGSWLILSVSFHGLAIAGFWSGGEALEADMRGLIWYGALALVLRWATAITMSTPALRAIVPDLAIAKILRMTFWGAMSEAPIALVLVLLCDPQRPINLATVIALIGLGAAVVLTAWHFRMRAEGLRGGRANAGELTDSVFALAKRMEVPLRRIYILPEDISPRLGPKAGSHGDLLIPARLVQSAYRRELDGILAYQMMLIKTRYMNSFWSGLFPLIVILVWRLYNAQNAPSATVTLIAQAGMALSAVATFGQTWRRIHSKAQKAFNMSGGDAEGWIAGLAHIARLSGTEVAPGLAEKIAKQTGVPVERVPDLVTKGFPETGHYPVPDFDRGKLVPVS